MIGWLKVNFDKAFDERHNQGEIGVVVRDLNGSFMAAITLNVEGIKSLTSVECMTTHEVAAFAQL